ncbi:hypothetical protein [Hydrogenophaga sp.]|uniref:hypothetical protein n=1 Tax=Hydrogenophaga sp. TaxID=1904254 RepID=UPI003D0C91D0
MKITTPYLIAGAAVLGALVWAATRAGGAAGLGSAIGGAAVDLVDGAVSGVVVGVGEVVGIPATNKTQCEIDRAKGDTWAASFSCPAKDFLRYLWD